MGEEKAVARITFIIQREYIDRERSVQPKVLFPIEPAFAAALLLKHGHTVNCIDLNCLQVGQNPSVIISQTLAQFNPDFVVSVPQYLSFLVTEQLEDTCAIFQQAKNFSKAVTTIYCGAFATSYPQAALERNRADYLIRGEFEEAVLSLVESVSRGDNCVANKGIISSQTTGDFSSIATVGNLDKLPFPAYTAFDYRKYFCYPGRGNLRFPEYGRRYTHYQTSRGCSCQCCFCNIGFLRGSKLYRTRSLPLVLHDLEVLVKQFRVQEIHFVDDNLTLDKRRTIELCQGIQERKLSFKWIAAGGMSVYSLNEDVLHNLWRAGCYRLNLAFESGCQETIDKIIHKPVKLKRDVQVLIAAKRIGFEIIGYFVIGFPGETREQIAQTLSFAAHPLFDYVTLSIATPQEGTKLKEMCVAKGLLDHQQCLADVSRRSTALFSTVGYSPYELEKIRWKRWDMINFGSPAKRKVNSRILGLSLKGIQALRARTARNFKKRWPKSKT